jgi:hypothetical protein
VWIIPANGNIALDVGGMSVAHVEGAIARGIVTWTSTPSREQDIVHGLVPDGVQEVSLTASNGATTTIAGQGQRLRRDALRELHGGLGDHAA